MTVSILGCGWYGLELAKTLVKKGITVKGSTTSADKLNTLTDAKIEPYLIDLPIDNETIDPAFFNCDVLWISIPPKVRTGNGEEYLIKIRRLITPIIAHQIKQVVLISSTSVYGDTNSEVNELNEPGPDNESGKIMLRAENILKEQPAFTTTIIRFAGLIGPGRDPGRFFAGKTNIPNGNAPVNLIHLTDCIGISEAILTQQAFGYTYNACSPNHPTRSNFYTNAAQQSGLEAPHFINEKKSWKVVSGLNVAAILKYDYQVAITR
ncbi:SDR family oxidoreductase [Mucilaginibacter sp.]|uniref:SDR family oxidoreductase n=1 Tax=Mucilaginibacter sp. TaxID=1882438 RepID=UPI00261D8EAA|nr:SDR family oxidoreductase [Mucilaginibacter sp.]MDB5032196.1 family oxidoreductase [Mucilaginibacter sp.]